MQTVTDLFAPAQFREMTDDEKLTAPAFEPMQAGIRFASPAYVCGPAVVEPEIRYAREIIYRPPQPAAPPAAVAPAPTRIAAAAATTPVPVTAVKLSPVAAGDFVVPADFVRQVAAVGSAAQVPIAQTGIDRYEAPSAGVALKAPNYAVVVGHGLDATVDAVKPPPQISLPEPPGPGGTVVGLPDYTAATQALDARLEARPAERGRLRVVPVYTDVGELA